MIKEVMAGRSGQGLITDDEKEYYISYAPIPMDGISDSWSVISLQEKTTAMQLMDRILRSGILATIATVVLAVILIFLLTRTITKPIQYCLKRLTDLSKGDLSTELPAIKGRDEISQLLEAVGNTIETLKKIIDDITEQLHRISDGDLTNQAVYVYSKDFNGLGQSLGAISLSLNQSLKRVSAHSAEVLANAATLSQTAQSLAKDTELQENAVEKLASEIEKAQIFMVVGGFSLADEPDGSGKFIVSVLRNPKIKAALNTMRANEGLILGICNGFQALVKSGLLPFGDLDKEGSELATLFHNDINRHVSHVARTRITSNKSPWLQEFEPGQIHSVAISHGEGKFMADPELLKSLAENGQIATQYVGENGNPTMDGEDNLNGSNLAIEGILSADGMIFGKMGHSERYEDGLFQNIAGDRDQNIFASGVHFFTHEGEEN